MAAMRATATPSRLRRAVVITTTAIGLLAGTAPLAQSAETTTQHGPDPTEGSITAPTGPFQTDQKTVPRSSVQGFGGGTIYYPTETSQGTFGAVTIAPGYTAGKESLAYDGYTGDQSSMAWYGPRLASQGFVVFTIDTITTSDQPDSRAKQLMASLDYLTGDSDVRDRIDTSRLAVMGHSMGGGGTLEAARDNRNLKAAIPMTPWDTTKDFSGVQTPTLIIGAQNDTIAPVAQHAKPFYGSLPDDPGKAYLELAGASHFAPNQDNTTIAKSSIAWLKRFVDDDTRYDQFLCPPPQDAEISDYQSTCPY